MLQVSQFETPTEQSPAYYNDCSKEAFQKNSGRCNWYCFKFNIEISRQPLKNRQIRISILQ